MSQFSRRDFLQASTGLLLASDRSSVALLPSFHGTDAVTFDPRSLRVEGNRLLLISGEMHYTRSTRSMWPQLLDRSQSLGINCIATYVFWNVHEPERDRYDFSGERDLRHFLSLCADRKMNVFLRVGPYICAEWNFGGFPPYLRDEPGITFRTMSKPYLDRVQKYFERLSAEIKPFLASNGGPVALVQVENEYSHIAKRYGAKGQEYLRWIVELGNRVGFSTVPTTTCEGGAAGAIETANGDIITPERVAELRKSHPRAPLLWSELYPGWYQVWGGARKPQREPGEMAFAILSFIALGGSGWNYYMWHGGTNFGRTSMYLQTTSYSFEAPLDEYGRPTDLAHYLANLHRVLRSHEQTLLGGQRASQTLVSGLQKTTWRSAGGSLTLIVNQGTEPATEGEHTLPGKSARLLAGDTIEFDTHAPRPRRTTNASPPWLPATATALQWSSWSEPLPQQRQHEGIESERPVEQLSLTKDLTDYCWYSASLHIATAGTHQLTIPYGGDFFYIFLDGKLVAQSPIPLPENRGPITPDDPEHPRIATSRHDFETKDGFRHSYSFSAGAVGSHRLEILATALGMIKGDWQIASPMNMERKGIWEGVQIDGIEITGWRMIPGLQGEGKGLPQTVGDVHAVAWRSSEVATPLTWHKATFALEPGVLAGDADFRLDAVGLGKGQLFCNGHAAGRHWLLHEPAPAGASEGALSQRYYHIPASWLLPQNTLILLEEQAASPKDVRMERRTWRT
jgi:beta-galactosidase